MEWADVHAGHIYFCHHMEETFDGLSFMDFGISDKRFFLIYKWGEPESDICSQKARIAS